MAPDVPTITGVPERRLKAVIQANALFEALLAAVCIVARKPVANLLSLPTPTFSLPIGFGLAFSSTFLFRVAAKYFASSRIVGFVAAANLAAAFALVAFVFLEVLYFTQHGVIALVSIAAVNVCFAVAQLVLLFRSSHGYQQTEVVAV